jgi:hypothetical protein
MRLSALRARLSTRTLAALLTLIVCGGAVDWGHAGGDDPDCNPVLVHHDHTAHRFSSQPAPRGPAADHCYICHSLRLLHTGLTARAAAVVQDSHTGGVYRPSPLVVGADLTIAQPSRAPPVLSL